MKTCTTCKETKELSKFARRTDTGGYRAQCRECRKKIVAEYKQNNKEKIKEQAREYYKNNKEAILNYSKEHYRKNTERYKNYRKIHYKNNKEMYLAKDAKRRAAKLQAASYMKELDKFAIEEAYALAQQRTEETGIPWDVDHIVPLQHPEACGLHVAANIQVVPASWNRAKNNRNMDIYIG